jgi:hypothetical protein
LDLYRILDIAQGLVIKAIALGWEKYSAIGWGW